ncbi:hypothetical protein [Acinetobacter sp. NCu2D-2]|uniref:hypothetical protein n=1 Tax=Acinetobacter sp. NCu2D-2 TaxID=1608473 RepID=UPI003FA42DE6
MSLVFENYYQRNLAYPQQDYANSTALQSAFPQWSASQNDVFDFSSQAIDEGKGYELTATAKSSSKLVGCTFKLNNRNERTATVQCDGQTTW